MKGGIIGSCLVSHIYKAYIKKGNMIRQALNVIKAEFL